MKKRDEMMTKDKIDVGAGISVHPSHMAAMSAGCDREHLNNDQNNTNVCRICSGTHDSYDAPPSLTATSLNTRKWHKNIYW